MHKNEKKRVCIMGSGKWGSAIAKLVGENVIESYMFCETVKIFVHDKNSDGCNKLVSMINEKHINPKYLPGVTLPRNIVACSCPKEVAKDADIIIFVQRQQFLADVCDTLKGHLKKGVIGISLTKSLYHGVRNSDEEDQLLCASDIIRTILGIDVAVLSGPNLADEIAQEKLSETSIGCSCASQLSLWKELFSSKYFIVRPCAHVKEVELCGALKNIVATASGIADGIECGGNSKAAIIRLGLIEIQALIALITGDVCGDVLWQPCGFADLIATCYGGITRKIVQICIKSKRPLHEVEEEHFSGMVLEGPVNAKQVYEWLKNRDYPTEKFPVLCSVYKIFHEGKTPDTLLEVLKSSF